MSIDPTPRTHPVLACVGVVDRALDEVFAVEPVFMTKADKQAALVELSRTAARLEGLRLRVLAAADDVAEQTGARSTAVWLADQTRDAHGPTARAQRLAHALDQRFPATGVALGQGRVNPAQAHVIVEALDALPNDLDAEQVVKAEAHLLSEAGQFGPRELRRLGARLMEVIAPALADEHEYQRLLEAERRAHSATRLSFRPRGDGSTDLHARLPDHVAGRLRTYLDAFTSPRRFSGVEPGVKTSPLGDFDLLPLTRRRGEAFCALLENLPDAGLPTHGGTATSVVVNLDLDDLIRGLGVAVTSTGDPITAEQARRLACTARIIPAVLGHQGEILDLGRSARLFTPAQRKAMAIRDRGCTTDGCSIPAAWCEAHHWKKPWSMGGRTDLGDGKLLCSFHHHRAHDPGWLTSHQSNGATTFTRRE